MSTISHDPVATPPSRDAKASRDAKVAAPTTRGREAAGWGQQRDRPPKVERVASEQVAVEKVTIEQVAIEPALDDFDAFFDRVFPRAVRVARRLIGDPTEAEDLAAEAMARAYARWPSVRRHVAPDGWVLRTTINLAIDSLRKRKRTSELASVDGPEDIIALRVTLAAAMGSLSRRQREIVSLRYLADLSEHDVAAALAITPGSVKTHLSRALGRLRSVLGAQVEEVSDALPG